VRFASGGVPRQKLNLVGEFDAPSSAPSATRPASDCHATPLSLCLSQPAMSRQAPPSVRCPINSERRRPGSMRTATLVALHKALTAVACGKATISSSARTKIGASMSDSRARRPSAGKQPRAPTKMPFRRPQEVGAGQIERARVPVVEPCGQRRVARALQSRFRAEFSRVGESRRVDANSLVWPPPERHALDRSTCANCAKSMQVRRPRIILKTIKEGGSNGRS
jgi:hypothetical protein